VASTMIIANMAGVKIFATGGIGGVHRGAETTMDISADLEVLKKEIADRDYKDSHRSVSPLRPAEDSITFDTTGVSISDVVAFIEEKAKKILDK